MRSRAMSGTLTAGLLAAISLAAVGCGAAAPSGPPPVRIGALIPVTGLGISYYVAAFQAAARDVNAHGGVKGRPVTVEVCDDRNNPNLAQTCARQLVSDGVIATASNVSEFSMVEGPILDEAGIPQVGGEAINPEDFTLPTAFPLEGGIFSQVAGGLVGMKRRGLHSLFAVTLDTPPGRTVVGLVGQLCTAAGIDLVGAAYIPAAAADPTDYVQAAIQSKADAIFPALPPTMTVPFMIVSRRAGARYLVMVPYGEFTPQDIASMGGSGAVTENDIEFAALPPLSATARFPALRTFASDMAAELAAGDRSAAPEHLTGGSLAAWLSVQVIARVAATLDVVDAPHLLRALQTSATIDTLGLTPTWAPGRTAGALPTFPRVTNLFGYLDTQRNGVEVLADPVPFAPLLVLGLAG